MGKYRGDGPPTVTANELNQALELAWKTNERDAMIIETLAETGLRNSECRLLEIADVWTGSDIVLELKLRAETAKGGRPRNIPLLAGYRAKLRTYILKHRPTITGGMEREPLFPSNMKGGHLTRRGICRIVGRYFRAVNSNATPHWLRHSCATELLRVTNARVVQLMLGHRRMETVQIYTHPTGDDLRDAMTARAESRKKFVAIKQESPNYSTSQSGS
jgi:site-specific recombinase XerD